jgi:hypothetical protein
MLLFAVMQFTMNASMLISIPSLNGSIGTHGEKMNSNALFVSASATH